MLSLWVAGLAAGTQIAPVRIEPPVPLSQEAPWRVVNFAGDAEVLRRMVFDVAFETNGVAWFAVSDGLYRYDGHAWQRFSASNGLPSSFVRTVTVTRDGSLWVGTDQGAGVFDGQTFDRRGTENRLAGPSVRRMVETSDGALWFCCDRWPDPGVPGGLTRWKAGEARSYGVNDGLPSSSLLNVFEQSNGRLIALTSGGAAQRSGDRWVEFREDPFPQRDATRAMQETPDGRLFAQTSNGTWVFEDGHWSECPNEGGPSLSPFCVTREGAVIKGMTAPAGALWFANWNGHTFTRASAEVMAQGSNLQVVRQAPDEAIWAVGRGTILRWEYQRGPWSWHPELPAPVLEDRHRRIWFADKEGAAVMEDNQVTRIPEMRMPLLEDAEGAVWGGTSTGVARWADGRLESFSPDTSGLARLEGGTVDATGTVWLYGWTQDRRNALTCRTGNAWKVLGPDELGGRRVISTTPAGRRGIWIVLAAAMTGYELAHASADGSLAVQTAAANPRTHFPSLTASQSHLFLYGYKGLWESPLEEPLRFTQVSSKSDSVFTQAASIGDVAAFLAQEGFDGKASILLRRRGEWIRHPVAYGENLWLGRDGWLIVADGPEFVLWQTREWNSPAYVSLPTDATISTMLRTTGGDFWLGTQRGGLHLSPDAHPPDTVLSGPRTLIEGTTLAARAIGAARFAPRAQARRYSFTWRVDDGPWSSYGDWPVEGLALAGLKKGAHVLEARARDGLGIEDPSPAQLAFNLLPLPIQDRSWFRPGLIVLGLGFTSLSLALYGATRRLRRHASHLEEEVEARTAELRRDIARREQVESALRESESRLRANLENTPNVAVQWYDEQGQIVYWNRASETLYGWTAEEVIGQTLATSILGPAEAKEFLRILARVRETGQAYGPYEVKARRRDGSECWIVATAFAIPLQPGRPGFACMDVDITQRKKAEQEQERLQSALLQAQKMESVGRLAGGVAHDFNNMLQAILGNTALAMEDLPPQSSLRECLDEIQKSALRSADLTRQLLAFARKQTIRPQVLDLNDTVGGMLKMLRRLIGEDIQLIWVPGARLWPVLMDPSQVDQILANLCVNARDAIEGAGQLTITTHNVTLDSAFASSRPDAKEGDYVRLTVADTGHGMDTETQSHLFEPFFTTKAPGKGTGLGLATVFGIVKQNRGLIEVTSAPGRGTTFILHLPRTSSNPAAAELRNSAPARRGTETLLLVEDEEQVLSLGRRILEQLGYRVLVAANPAQALTLAEKHAGPIHLLVTDVIMPGMNGKVLRDTLQAVRPQLKCLFMSGYTADLIARHGVLDQGVRFLQKPFGIETLANQVREILDPATESHPGLGS